MTVTSRLISSFGATALGPAVTILIQIFNVPIMLHIWGSQLFGEWLVLSAIPTYLLLSDMGFGNVAGSAMTMRVHAGDRDGALVTFQSTIALVALSSTALAAIAGVLLLMLPLHRLLHLQAIQPHQARVTLLLLSLNCLVLLQWSVLMAAYRCTQRYAFGMLYVNCIRLVEGAGVFLILFTHAQPQTLAAFMLLVSVGGTGWLIIEHRRSAPWLPLGFRHAQWSHIRALTRPAFAYMAFPASAALSTQGMTLIVGVVLGPSAVALFNPMRTLSRIALQATDAVKTSVWPELSAAFGRDDKELARRLHRGAFQISLLLAIVILVALGFAGPRLFDLWTRSRLALDRPAFHLLLVVVLANSIWNASSSVALSVNRHEGVSLSYLVLSVASVGAAAALARPLGLQGVALGMLLADAGMTIVVLRSSTRILEDSLADFLRACAHPIELMRLLSRVSLPYLFSSGSLKPAARAGTAQHIAVPPLPEHTPLESVPTPPDPAHTASSHRR